jgi:hypothetical protein
MNWTLVLIGFSLAVLMGAGLASLLATLRPEWSVRRRALTAASVLPAITAVATLLGLLFVAAAARGQDARMAELAIAAVLMGGGGFTLLALLGGLVGAGVAGRGRKR